MSDEEENPCTKYCLLPVRKPGTFEFYLQVENIKYRTQFFCIPPVLRFSEECKPIDPKAICIQTMVPRWMGRLDNWDKYLEICSTSGYNMVHFVPMQKRGISNSPYSIADQLGFSDDLFDKVLSEEAKEIQIIEMMTKMKSKFHLIPTTDIVWNHVACDCPWLTEHPEAGYNLENSPHLKSAFELDEAIMHFSEHINNHSPTDHVHSHGDVSRVMDCFAKFVLEYRLWEYFTLDRWIEIEKFEKALLQAEESRAVEEEDISNFNKFIEIDRLRDRFCHKLNIAKVVNYFISKREANLPHNLFVEKCKHELKEQIDKWNAQAHCRYEEKITIALGNIEGRLTYERLAEHGPKLGKISKKYNAH